MGRFFVQLYTFGSTSRFCPIFIGSLGRSYLSRLPPLSSFKDSVSRWWPDYPTVSGNPSQSYVYPNVYILYKVLLLRTLNYWQSSVFVLINSCGTGLFTPPFTLNQNFPPLFYFSYKNLCNETPLLSGIIFTEVPVTLHSNLQSYHWSVIKHIYMVS